MAVGRFGGGSGGSAELRGNDEHWLAAVEDWDHGMAEAEEKRGGELGIICEIFILIYLKYENKPKDSVKQ